ncbi:MAG: hypothetical protein ABR577_02160 [Pyrinomonadaceae bacterium]
MKKERAIFLPGIVLMIAAIATYANAAQNSRAAEDVEFGPNVRAYLGYLRSEQEVVDDRASRHEISAAYYRRNLNRIRALRQIAIRTARENNNDYLPEFEAVTRDEFKSLFETPPRPETFRVGEVLNSTFRFLGTARTGEIFYIFARLDPYEQAELLQKSAPPAAASKTPASPVVAPSPRVEPAAASRPRRAGSPPR